MTRHAYPVALGVFKVERKKGLPVTTLHVRLPNLADLDLLERAYDVQEDNGGAEIAEFTLHVDDGGASRELLFAFRGLHVFRHDRCRAYATLEKTFQTTDRLDLLVDNPHADLRLVVEVRDRRDDQARLPFAGTVGAAVLEAIADLADGPAGTSVTVISGGKSVELTPDTARKARRMARAEREKEARA